MIRRLAVGALAAIGGAVVGFTAFMAWLGRVETRRR